MSVKRATFSLRPKTRETIFYSLAKQEREISVKERRQEKLARRQQSTEH